MLGVVFLSCLSGEHNRELAVLAVTAAQILSQGKTPEEATRLAMFFTILGDTLSLFALEPEQAADCGRKNA